MTDTTDGGCYIAMPTRLRFWRWAGFRFHLGKDSEETIPWSGWMKSETRFYFGLADRLRLLLTGKLIVAHVVDMDTPSPAKTFTRVDWHILPPGEKL